MNMVYKRRCGARKNRLFGVSTIAYCLLMTLVVLGAIEAFIRVHHELERHFHKIVRSISDDPMIFNR